MEKFHGLNKGTLNYNKDEVKSCRRVFTIIMDSKQLIYLKKKRFVSGKNNPCVFEITGSQGGEDVGRVNPKTTMDTQLEYFRQYGYTPVKQCRFLQLKFKITLK